MSDQSAPDLVFDALGEPARRRILELLRDGPVAVGALAAQLPIGRPAVSKHLRVLSGAQLIQHRRSGTRNLYSLAPQGLVQAQQWLTRNWDETLAAFGAYVADHAAGATPPEVPAAPAVGPDASPEVPAAPPVGPDVPPVVPHAAGHQSSRPHQPARRRSRSNP